MEELGQEACEYMPKLVDSYLAIQATPRPAKKTLSLLFPTSYPFQSRAATTEAPFDEAMAEISAVLAAMSSLPALIHLDWTKDDTAEFLFSILTGLHFDTRLRSLSKLMVERSHLPSQSNNACFGEALQRFAQFVPSVAG